MSVEGLFALPRVVKRGTNFDVDKLQRIVWRIMMTFIWMRQTVAIFLVIVVLSHLMSQRGYSALFKSNSYNESMNESVNEENGDEGRNFV